MTACEYDVLSRLSQYGKLRAEMRSLKRLYDDNIASIRDVSICISTSTPVQGGTPTYQPERIAILIEGQVEALRRSINRIDAQMAEIMTWIDTLADSDERLVIREMYCNFTDKNKIMGQLHCEKTRMYALRNRALRNLAKTLLS